jgi:hypothetical protein
VVAVAVVDLEVAEQVVVAVVDLEVVERVVERVVVAEQVVLAYLVKLVLQQDQHYSELAKLQGW